MERGADSGLEQRVLGLEVVVKAPEADISGVGDLLDAHVGPALAQELAGGTEQGVTGALLAPVDPGGHVCSARHPSFRSTIGGFNAAPIVGLSGSSVVEPGTGSVAAPVRVALSAPSGRTVSVRLHTVAGTADSSDFAPVDTTVTFPPGATSRAIDVPVLADAVDEPAEVFELQVVALTHAQVGAGTATIAILPPAV